MGGGGGTELLYSDEEKKECSQLRSYTIQKVKNYILKRFHAKEKTTFSHSMALLDNAQLYGTRII
jgi:hypothetical protein